MSRFTGKCDFYDDCEMIHSPKDMIKKLDLYLGEAKVDIKNEKDLIPYYTHLVSLGSYSDNRNVIHLSVESFIDSEEKDWLSTKISSVIKAARKAKREKVPFDFEYYSKSEYSSFIFKNENDLKDKKLWKTIISNVNENPNIIKIHLPKDFIEERRLFREWIIPEYFSKIHDDVHNRFRQEFVTFAKEHGYSVPILQKNSMAIATTGVYHPIIYNMCAKIKEYEEMIK